MILITGVVEVREKTMDGWWLVKCGSKQGRVPATNLRRANTRKAQHIIDIGTQADSEKKVLKFSHACEKQ